MKHISKDIEGDQNESPSKSPKLYATLACRLF